MHARDDLHALEKSTLAFLKTFESVDSRTAASLTLMGANQKLLLEHLGYLLMAIDAVRSEVEGARSNRGTERRHCLNVITVPAIKKVFDELYTILRNTCKKPYDHKTEAKDVFVQYALHRAGIVNEEQDNALT